MEGGSEGSVCIWLCRGQGVGMWLYYMGAFWEDLTDKMLFEQRLGI